MNTAGLVKKGARNLAWFIKGVMGEDAYDKYKAHHESRHPSDGCEAPPVMTEREFWRDQTDRQETNPQGRCC